jgi:hypothetical protein
MIPDYIFFGVSWRTNNDSFLSFPCPPVPAPVQNLVYVKEKRQKSKKSPPEGTISYPMTPFQEMLNAALALDAVSGLRASRGGGGGGADDDDVDSLMLPPMNMLATTEAHVGRHGAAHYSEAAATSTTSQKKGGGQKEKRKFDCGRCGFRKNGECHRFPLAPKRSPEFCTVIPANRLSSDFPLPGFDIDDPRGTPVKKPHTCGRCGGPFKGEKHTTRAAVDSFEYCMVAKDEYEPNFPRSDKWKYRQEAAGKKGGSETKSGKKSGKKSGRRSKRSEGEEANAGGSVPARKRAK